ncbi:NAD synthetase [Oligella urethralis]|uniref:NAD synthetase n=2 Tax=Oligella urethralis TaxID=90245 RepID=A0A2X1UMA7_9BURK|nr:NAD synthetase [Oligella urethralis]SUA61320.1 NAD synthetase [Oligella urethralis]
MLKLIYLEELRNKTHNLKCFDLQLSLDNDNITITNPYNSNKLYYLHIDSKRIAISDSYYELPDFKVSINGVLESISEHFSSKPVFFENYHTLPHGFKFIFNLGKNTSEISRVNNNLAIDIDPVICLHNTLKHINKDNIAISFSGGLDSTILLYSIKDSFPNKNIVAFNWYNKGTSNNDLLESRKICKKLGIRLLKIEIAPDLLFIDLNTSKHYIPSFPSTYISYLGFIERYVFILDKYFEGRPFTIVNGHGGDQIFYEDVPIEIFNLKNFFKYKSKLSDYVELYSLNYFSFIKSITNLKFNFKLYKDKLINDTLYQTSTAFIKLPQHINFFYPFTSEEMIAYADNVDIFDTFDSMYTRCNIRQRFSTYYNSNDFYRINKGHMTGAYQRALKTHKTKILKNLEYGKFKELNIRDMNVLLEKFSLATMGVAGIDPSLLYVINFENILKTLKGI